MGLLTDKFTGQGGLSFSYLFAGQPVSEFLSAIRLSNRRAEDVAGNVVGRFHRRVLSSAMTQRFGWPFRPFRSPNANKGASSRWHGMGSILSVAARFSRGENKGRTGPSSRRESSLRHTGAPASQNTRQLGNRRSLKYIASNHHHNLFLTRFWYGNQKGLKNGGMTIHQFCCCRHQRDGRVGLK